MMTIVPSRFDRHYETRRNRRHRNIFLAISGASLLFSVVLYLDPIVSGSSEQSGFLLLFVFVFFLSLGLTLFFHLRFLSRE